MVFVDSKGKKINVTYLSTNEKTIQEAIRNLIKIHEKKYSK